MAEPKRAIAVPGDQIVRVTVDYTRPFAEMIQVGKYGWAHSDINERNFPMKGEGKVERELILVHLNVVARTDKEVLAEMGRRGLRPTPRIEDPLALGAARPELQMEFPIVAIGCSFLSPFLSGLAHQVGGTCSRSFVCLRQGDAGRILTLDHGLDGWNKITRFLAIR